MPESPLLAPVIHRLLVRLNLNAEHNQKAGDPLRYRIFEFPRGHNKSDVQCNRETPFTLSVSCFGADWLIELSRPGSFSGTQVHALTFIGLYEIFG